MSIKMAHIRIIYFGPIIAFFSTTNFTRWHFTNHFVYTNTCCFYMALMLASYVYIELQEVLWCYFTVAFDMTECSIIISLPPPLKWLGHFCIWQLPFNGLKMNKAKMNCLMFCFKRTTKLIWK